MSGLDEAVVRLESLRDRVQHLRDMKTRIEAKIDSLVSSIDEKRAELKEQGFDSETEANVYVEKMVASVHKALDKIEETLDRSIS